jgi:hypothetical protein
MDLSSVAPIRTSKDQHWQGRAAIDLRKAFTWLATMFIRARDTGTEQVIFDIGANGTTADRIQLFIDPSGGLVFRVKSNALEIPAAAVESLTGQWMPLAAQAKLRGKKLSLRLFTTELDWADTSTFDGPALYGNQMRIGGALSGGRGLEMNLLDMAMWSAVVPKTKVKMLMEFLETRPSAFGLEHGPQ